MLEKSTAALSESYDLAMLDLDGVVYIGPDAVPGAAQHLQRARTAGMHLAFVTNNASRTPRQVAAHLNGLGIEADPDDVVTSAQAAAHLLFEQFGLDARIYVLGGDGLEEALRGAGLQPVTSLAEEPVAVVTGYAPEVPWKRIMVGGVLIRDGLPWVASNTDMTVPTDYGLGPGHGVQVQMLADFAGVEPRVAGKPQRPLLDETIRRVGGERPLMVGDRLDTDIEGANNAGIDSLLVLTGVAGMAELVAAPRALRPTYISSDLGGLFTAHGAPSQTSDGHTVGGWSGRVREGRLEVAGSGSPDDWWRVVAAASWEWLDESGDPADPSGVREQVPAETPSQGTVAS
ncbi:MAG: HAD-IIA family hydrolase [Nocardioides sp.]|nr:HAD-IIA family hydrolase [Nocardioides sp.]